MDNIETNFEIIKLNAYTTPKILEDKSKEFIQYLVKDDSLANKEASYSYYDYLDNRYNESTTNKALINQISRLIYGKGLDALDSNVKPEQFAEALNLLPKKEIKRLVLDRKKYGFGALQIQYKNKYVSRISHIPSNKLLSGKKNDKNKVVSWWYCDDWQDDKLEPTELPLFNTTNNSKTEVYIFSPYSSGDDYYSYPDYSGALGYAYLEERITEYLINDVDNGFSGTKVINFNNGIPQREKREQIKNQTKNKLIGSTGDRVIISFNKGEENKTTVDSIPLDNAPEHYKFLAEECESKILKGHNAPAWLLGANNGGQGLGSNADEIKNQMTVFDNFVIKPYQEEIIDGLEEILAVNGINIKLYFKTIQPLEFIGLEVDVDSETVEEETGIKKENQLNKIHLCNVKLSKDYDELIDFKIAEDLIALADDDLEGWELIDEKEVDYDNEEELDAFIEKENKAHRDRNSKKTLLQKIKLAVSTGVARPQAKSEQDIEKEDALYKVRYVYSPNKVGANSRAFCKAMVRASKMYRKEDIVALENKVVNAGFGEKGSDMYSIWFYKGGALCNHYWKRQTYRFTGRGKEGGDVTNPNAKKVAGFGNNNPREVATKPKNMKYEGFVSAESRKRFLGY